MALARSFARLRPAGRRRRGFISLEMILVLIVLVIATLGAIQFGIALTIKQAVAHAATVGAREAGKDPVLAELVPLVESVLAAHGLSIGADVSLVLEDGVLPPDMAGSLACTPPAMPVLDADEVRVTVCVSLTALPFTNILSPFGIDFTGQTFQASSVAKKES